MNIIQAVLLLTGACMVFFPRVLTKQADRDKEEAVKRTRNLGYWVFMTGAVWLLAAMIMG